MRNILTILMLVYILSLIGVMAMSVLRTSERAHDVIPTWCPENSDVTEDIPENLLTVLTTTTSIIGDTGRMARLVQNNIALSLNVNLKILNEQAQKVINKLQLPTREALASSLSENPSIENILQVHGVALARCEALEKFFVTYADIKGPRFLKEMEHLLCAIQESYQVVSHGRHFVTNETTLLHMKEINSLKELFENKLDLAEDIELWRYSLAVSVDDICQSALLHINTEMDWL